MTRAATERQWVIREWKARRKDDEFLSPGYFRKGRRALGCPRWCAHCRAVKLEPTRHLLRSNLAIREWIGELASRTIGFTISGRRARVALRFNLSESK